MVAANIPNTQTVVLSFNVTTFLSAAERYPGLRLVVDHVAKPLMSQGEEAGLRGWAEDMRAAAQHRSG